MKLPDSIVRRNRRQPGRERLNRLTVHGQDQAIEIPELIIDAANGTIGGLGDIPNLE